MYRTLNWVLIYSLDADGCSIGTFFEKSKHYKHTLLVIKENKGFTFGGYCNEAW